MKLCRFSGALTILALLTGCQSLQFVESPIPVISYPTSTNTTNTTITTSATSATSATVK